MVLGERSTAKTYCPVSPLSVVSKVLIHILLLYCLDFYTEREQVFFLFATSMRRQFILTRIFAGFS